MDRTTAAGKVAALNFLMPYVQRLPNRLLRSEWATRIAALEFRVDEPVLREALRRAAAERRSEVKPKAELSPRHEAGRAPADADARRSRRFPRKACAANRGRIPAQRTRHRADIRSVARHRDNRRSARPGGFGGVARGAGSAAFLQVVFESAAEPSWDEAESCLSVLRRRHIETELQAVQKELESHPAAADLNRLLARKQDLRKRLSGHSA